MRGSRTRRRRCCATSSASSNPWGKPQAERAAWAEGLDVRVLEPGDPAPEILYWVGCAASFDERARATARATATLLLEAGLDVAILGPREGCTGDPSRRMGDEYTFQAQARQNVGTLDDAGVTKIVTSCPHCFNTLGNEYPDFGGRYEVVHHTELLAELVRDGRLRPAAGAGDHVPRLVLPRASQRRPRGSARDRRAHRPAARDGAQRQADVLLRRRRCAHVDGGARDARSTRSARARRSPPARRRWQSRARSAR